jgi:hypothetical protein
MALTIIIIVVVIFGLDAWFSYDGDVNLETTSCSPEDYKGLCHEAVAESVSIYIETVNAPVRENNTQVFNNHTLPRWITGEPEPLTEPQDVYTQEEGAEWEAQVSHNA